MESQGRFFLIFFFFWDGVVSLCGHAFLFLFFIHFFFFFVLHVVDSLDRAMASFAFE